MKQEGSKRDGVIMNIADFVTNQKEWQIIHCICEERHAKLCYGTTSTVRRNMSLVNA